MDIVKLRRQIDSIDTRLLGLLNERARFSIEVGKAKLSQKKGIYAPERERQLLERLKAINTGPMADGALEAVWREIMSGSIALEKPLRIAHLGEAGSYSHSAASHKFGSQVTYVAASSIPEVFQAVERGGADYGVVPIENSVEGSVTPTADMLADSDLLICAQLKFRIVHNLLSRTPMESIRKVYSNPQVLAQCRQWLLAHLPPAKVHQISVASTTEASRIARREKGAAALASMECSRIYGVPALACNVQDMAHNTTRFFVIARQDVPPTGRDRTSIVFSIKDRAGALYAMLAPFARNRINLTRIESRPIKKKAWDYYFFVDLEGHREDSKVKKALGQLDHMCKFLKILGSYPE
jgi:chorismate mutase/prephenate dehydratase